MFRNREKNAERDQFQKIRGRLFEAHFQNSVIERADAHFIFRTEAVFCLFCIQDGVKQMCIRSRESGVKKAFPGIFEVMSRDRDTVAPKRFPEVKSVRFPVMALHYFFGEAEV